jgi:hypothetical protein
VNFTNITYIRGTGGAEEYFTFSTVHSRTINGVVELVVCRCLHVPVLMNWFGDPVGVRISSHSFMEWINKDNLKELYVEFSPTQ